MSHSTFDPNAPMRHLALFYRSVSEYVSAMSGFLLPGLAAGERVLVAVPPDKVEVLRVALADHEDAIAYVDMTDLGRNPARILPTVQAFLGGDGRRSRIVGEPIWPGRSEAEIREVIRHEALANLALSQTPATILCPYDSSALPTWAIANACRTHPIILRGSGEEPSMAYSGQNAVPADCDPPLSPPPASAESVTYDHDLRPVRQLIAGRAAEAGLDLVRTADLVLAVSEVAGNTIAHTANSGMVRIWRTGEEVICQVEDSGHITDPLAGRRLPDSEEGNGHGLWLVNRFCDLTEIRTGENGTMIRLHMRLADADWTGR
jgi:anti-sigma regulatory factor (Ser/Thr protein kinase)